MGCPEAASEAEWGARASDLKVRSHQENEKVKR